MAEGEAYPAMAFHFTVDVGKGQFQEVSTYSL